MPEHERVEDGLAGGVEGPVERHVAEGARVGVLAVNVEVQPGDQQVQACPHRAERRHEETRGRRFRHTETATRNQE